MKKATASVGSIIRDLSPAAKIKARNYITTASKLNAGELYSAISGKVKYTDLEVLNFCIQELAAIFVEGKPKKGNLISRYGTLVGGWTARLGNEDININPDLAVQIFGFKKLYEDYCVNAGVEVQEGFIKDISELIDYTKKHSVIPEETKEEPVEDSERAADLTNTIDKLNDKIRKLTAELESAKKESSTFKASNTKKEKKIARLEASIDELKSAVKKLEDELKTLNKSLEASKKAEEQSSEELEQLRTSLEAKIKARDSKIEDLEKTVSDKAAELIKTSSSIEVFRGTEVIEQEALDNRVLELILNKGMSANDIYYTLYYENLGVRNINDILASLNRIQAKYCISQSNYLNFGTPVYHIQAPFVHQGKTCFLPSNDCKNELDLILYSDLHLSPEESNSNAFKKLNLIYDYASEKGIKYIINLGDTIDGQVSSEDRTVEVLKRNEEFLASLVTKQKNNLFPEEFSIGILGGNHDYSFAEDGIDPVSFIANNTTNVINLGFNSANLRLGNRDTNEYIALHHAGIPSDSKVDNIFDQAKETGEFLKTRHPDIENMYWAFFGHHHRSIMVYDDRFCSVPSVNRDRSCDGACHVKLYFDSNNKIEFMVITRLSVTKKVLTTDEIAVQRKRS